MLKAYCYRIYPTNVQQQILRMQLGAVRFVYNYFLAEQQDRYEKKKLHLSFFDQCRELVELKRSGDYVWLYQTNAQSLYQGLKNLDSAYQNFFQKRAGHPRFKEAATPQFQEYQLQVVENARAMALRYKDRGYTVIPGGTDIHMFLVHLTDNEVPGVAAFEALSRANISVNKISSQKNPHSPRESHRLRIGSSAVTRRSIGTQECSTLADWMCDILDDVSNEDTIVSVRKKVLELCTKFPIYSQ